MVATLLRYFAERRGEMTILAMVGLILSILQFHAPQTWAVKFLNGYTSAEFEALEIELKATKSGKDLDTRWSRKTYEFLPHLTCMRRIRHIVSDRGFELENFDSLTTAKTNDGAFFSGLDGNQYVRGSFFCTNYHFSKDLSFLSIILVITTRSSMRSYSILSDIQNQIDLEMPRLADIEKEVKEHLR